MKLVIIESPYKGNIEENIQYAREAMHDSLKRGEAPLASHLLYTQPGILKDEDLTERSLGIAAGLAWGEKADLTAVYADRGISSGMKYGIDKAISVGRHVEFRSIRGKHLDVTSSS